MKMNYNCCTAAMCMVFTGVSTAFAGSISIGQEREYFISSGDRNKIDSAQNYVEVNFNPIERLNVFVKGAYRDQLQEASRQSRNRARQEVKIRYNFGTYGNWSFNPGFDWKMDNYGSHPMNTREFEYKFVPQMSYRINDTYSIGIDGFIGIVEHYRGARGDDLNDPNHGSKRYTYYDYKHEFEPRLNIRVNSHSNLSLRLFNEYSKESKKKGTEDFSQLYGREWQFRAQWSQAFNNWNYRVFVRPPSSRDRINVDGSVRNDSRWRAGAAGSYSVLNDLNVFWEVYYDAEKQYHWDGSFNKEAEKVFFKFGLQHRF